MVSKILLNPALLWTLLPTIWDISKKTASLSWWKWGQAISAIRGAIIHDAKNLGLVPILEVTSEKKTVNYGSGARQLQVYDIATYKRRLVCVTNKKYNTNEPLYIQIRFFTAKEKEALNYVIYFNYILNEIKELSQILGNVMFFENCNVQ